MREILFRGKGDTRYNDGDWYYGVPIYDGKDWQICTDFSKRVVLPETIGQFVEMTDNHNVKIFEGDILSIRFEEDRYPYEENAVVYFDNTRYGWCARFADGVGSYLWEYDESDIRVVGNIWDNPELLRWEILK